MKRQLTRPTPKRSSPRSISSVFVDTGILSEEQMKQAQAAATLERLSLSEVLIRDGHIVSRDFATIMALSLGLPFVNLRAEQTDPSAANRVPEHICRKLKALPISAEDGVLTVAMADPSDLQALRDLQLVSGLQVEPIIAVREEIEEHIDLAFRITTAEQESDQESGSYSGVGDSVAPLHRRLQEAQPARVIEIILQQAIKDRASDVHFEPQDQALKIRFRIDGLLQDVVALPISNHPPLISRLKIMASLNIAERRRPQDGQFRFESDADRVDVRVAVSNTVYGETVVLRLLDSKKVTLIGLDKIGMGEDSLDSFRNLLRLPYGMIIVCGPTGSGKSTTLYSSLLHMNRSEMKVITIEDPVEYQIPGVDQMQVHNEAGVTFATLMRSILRLDPDVILLGEIRDTETAVIATQAALTGHLVLTSIHANDAVSALVRLRDLGVPPYLVASSVAGILSQRMVRVVCPDCSSSVKRPVAEQQAYFDETGEQRERFVYGEGCSLCAQTGYRGRTGAFELLTMSDQIRQMFLNDAPRSELWDQALQDGMVPLRKDTMQKITDGITTPYEVMRVSFSL